MRTTAEALSLEGLRCTAEPLCSIHLRIPRASLEELQGMAERLRARPASLARVLLVQALADLTSAAEVG